MRLGPAELALLLVIAMLTFGGGRLPEIGGALCKAIWEFRKGMAEGTSHESDEGDEGTKGNA